MRPTNPLRLRASAMNQPVSPKPAVVLVSGGMDSAVVVAMAREQGFDVHALSVRYGQRHTSELDAADRVAHALGAVAHKTVNVDLRSIGGSALTDAAIEVPVDDDGHAIGRDAVKDDIPVTYVPARNTIMLSVALGWAEVLGAADIFCGVNAVDYSGYPDCRPEFVEAFERLANLATKAGVEGAGLRIHAPLQHMSKADIVREGLRLGVDFAQTVSCYQADAQGLACGHCDACRLRAEGFNAAGIADPTRYA
ncbi:7-cyano-7-deazaguanine synthase QueC [Lysobacter korlensis]|uniref:7-cyano-7-deazaguanine synthase n=1 Tax=Lysobacter korlensis TaxID=553636 RepID=A0ABV6RSH2_9GAMM